MKLIDVEQNTPEWLEARLGKISGSNIIDIWAAREYTKNDIVRILEEDDIEFKKSATKAVLEEFLDEEQKARLQLLAPKKIGFYRLIAAQIGVPPDEENRMERGHRLEQEAIDAFTAKYGKTVERVGICVSEADPNIINSPDGLIRKSPKSKIFNEAVEVKCLGSEYHLEAIITGKVPDHYWGQMMQYFVVNEKLEKCYWVFYDPRIAAFPLHVIEVKREDLGDWPQILLEFQIRQLKEVEEWVERLAF